MHLGVSTRGVSHPDGQTVYFMTFTGDGRQQHQSLVRLFDRYRGNSTVPPPSTEGAASAQRQHFAFRQTLEKRYCQCLGERQRQGRERRERSGRGSLDELEIA